MYFDDFERHRLFGFRLKGRSLFGTDTKKRRIYDEHYRRDSELVSRRSKTEQRERKNPGIRELLWWNEDIASSWHVASYNRNWK